MGGGYNHLGQSINCRLESAQTQSELCENALGKDLCATELLIANQFVTLLEGLACSKKVSN